MCQRIRPSTTIKKYLIFNYLGDMEKGLEQKGDLQECKPEEVAGVCGRPSGPRAIKKAMSFNEMVLMGEDWRAFAVLRGTVCGNAKTIRGGR